MAASKQARLDAKGAQLRAMIREVYTASEKVLVLGQGDPDSPLMLVGEAPGEQETLQRMPFVGKAGKNLDIFLQVLALAREQIYITNVVKFRPVKAHPRTGSLSNRPPTREEIELCRPLLMQEIEIIRPRVVVTLGNTPLRTCTDNWRIAIGAVHGTAFAMQAHGHSCDLFALYHPASIIYNRGLADTYHADLHALRA